MANGHGSKVRKQFCHAQYWRLIRLLVVFFSLGGLAMAVEERPYTITKQVSPFEIRDYPAAIVAQVSASGSRDQAASAGFRILAGYIFGGNTAKQNIVMTAPVVQAPAKSENIAMTAPVIQSGDAGGWLVQFVMPRADTLASLPKPNDPRVKIVSLPPSQFAVVRFSGLAFEADVARQTDILRKFIIRQHLIAIGEPKLARFDPPWTLWFLRRNEVMIEIRPV